LAHLYINAKGFEVRSHSYSASDTFRFCPQKYKLARIDGWQERERKASKEFGIAIESAIQFHHLNNLSGGPEEFTRLWALQKDADLTYTQTEQTWEALAKSGEEMLRLYHLRLPLFGLDLSKPPQFQIKYWKELFPGTDLRGIEFVAFIDMVTQSRELGDPMIVDIKTSSVALDTTPGILALDQQLRAYAWVTGVSDVAFLWFQKVGRTLEKGSRVSLLENAKDGLEMFAGESAIVAAYEENEDTPPLVYLVKDEAAIEEMNKAQGYKNGKLEQTKDAKQRKTEFLANFSLRADARKVTKQRVQFVNAHIPFEDQIEASRQIAQDVAQIVYSNEENFWPKAGSIRGLDKKCLNCPMRGICLNDQKLRDELLSRVDYEFNTQEND
jgi:hypothetical protein